MVDLKGRQRMEDEFLTLTRLNSSHSDNTMFMCLSKANI